MANVVITKNNALVTIDLGVLENRVCKISLNKAHVRDVKLATDDLYVELQTDLDNYMFSFESGTDVLEVDTVEGSAPTSNSDLYDKLVALIA